MKTTARSILLSACAAVLIGNNAVAQVSDEVLKSIHTPNEVETSIGKLKFIDGAPLPETAEKVYDYLDTARAMDTFLKGQPACSVNAIIDGAHSLGAVEAHEVVIFDKLMDSKSLFLTANTSTLYAFPVLDLKRDGPTVVEVPDKLLGAANDSYFRYVNDLMKAGTFTSRRATRARSLPATRSSNRRPTGSGSSCGPRSRTGWTRRRSS